MSLLNLKIEKLVYGGHGLAHHEGKTILIKGVLPGEEVQAELYKRKKGVHWAKLKQIVKVSEVRANPVCKHASECGGCSYQQLDHQTEIKVKEDILREIFSNTIELSETVASPEAFRYRNKCEFTFGDTLEGQVQLGLHPEGKFFEVLDLRECHLLPQPMWEVLDRIRDLANDSGLKSYRDLKDIGFWATITIRYSSSSGDLLLLWKVKDPAEEKLKRISEQLMAEFTQIMGVLARPTPRGEAVLLLGRDTLAQKVDEVDLVYSAENFFQINTFILPLLMREIVKLVKQVNPEVVYDLFGGVGAIGVYVAKCLPQMKKVIGAEADALASKYASFNAELNGLENYESHFLNLYKGRWGEMLKQHSENSCVIVDPPRAGMTSKTIREIVSIGPQSIVYMSCNPTTQKRDIDELKEFGYVMKSLKLIDMFPQTLHLESLALLQKE